MRKQRIYKGCELESPLYWQVVKEMKTKQTDKSLINEYKTKRGKHSFITHPPTQNTYIHYE